MAQAPVPLTYDGTNPEAVLDFLTQADPTNPPLKGGVNLTPPAPGDPIQITVEHADGTLVTVTQGATLTDLSTATDGVAIVQPVQQPPTPPAQVGP